MLKLLKRKFDQICTFSSHFFLDRIKSVSETRNRLEPFRNIKFILRARHTCSRGIIADKQEKRGRRDRWVVGSRATAAVTLPLLHNTHRRGIVVTFGDTSPLTFATCCERSNARARSTKRPNPRSIAYPLNSQPCASIPDFA